MYCPTCGTEVADGANFCTGCGADLQDRIGDRGAPGGETAESEPTAAKTGDDRGVEQRLEARRRADEGVRADTKSGVPSSAAAIDIACPLCGKRPIEEMAKGYRVNAFVLFYTMKTYELVGCHACIRRKLWGMSAINLVLGWWGIRAAVINFALTLKNVVRGAFNRGPNTNLQSALEDIGVTYDYLDDPSAYDPSTHSPDELYVRSFVRLGTAIMFADGVAHPEEKQAFHDAIQLVVPDFPSSKLDDLIDRASQTEADVERVAKGIGEVLGQEGKELVIAFVSMIADAGVTGDEDIELVATIARAMELSEDDIEAILASNDPSALPAD